jgi:hypothetical protein
MGGWLGMDTRPRPCFFLFFYYYIYVVLTDMACIALIMDYGYGLVYMDLDVHIPLFTATCIIALSPRHYLLIERDMVKGL